MRSSPTHGWVVGNRLLRWLATAFIIFSLIVFVLLFAITYTIRRDCTNPYRRDLKIVGYWVHIQAGSNSPSCPDR